MLGIIRALEEGRLEHLTTSGVIFITIFDAVLGASMGKSLDLNTSSYLKAITIKWLWLIGEFYFYRRIFVSLTSNPRNIGLLGIGTLVCGLVEVLNSLSRETGDLFWLKLLVSSVFVSNLFQLICAAGAILDVLFVIRSPQEVTAMMSVWVTMIVVHSLLHFVSRCRCYSGWPPTVPCPCLLSIVRPYLPSVYTGDISE
ncbi:unnamed protein product [Orchesella dallaii]|uniref:Transmembrane protein n=1 Tax=Orchesella dallaii TaxID=48710 RepID=A0ABP1RAA0_9HEXA